VLLGIPPDTAHGDYGWIEPGRIFAGGSHPLARPGARNVTGFWEKPGPELAATLDLRGCVWNSFVMIGRVRAFLDLIATAAPALTLSFGRLESAYGRADEARAARKLYAGLPTTDFSHHILQVRPERLGVLTVHGTRWSDLGDPSRLLSARACGAHA
jgi:mannose-1-phosphate guanylyltransferase